MSSLIKLIQESIDARVLRERAMIFLSAIAVLYLAWSFLIQAPFESKKREMFVKFDELVKQRAATQAQIASLGDVLRNDPERLKAEQITQLQQDIKELDTKLQTASQGLVKADQLPEVLQDVLLKTAKLTLLDVATLPVHEVQIKSLGGGTAGAVARRPQDIEDLGVYEHVVQLRMTGSYFEAIEFLTALESLPWRFYWQRLDYTVTEYPNAEIILRVYTLSSEEGLLGV